MLREKARERGSGFYNASSSYRAGHRRETNHHRWSGLRESPRGWRSRELNRHSDYPTLFVDNLPKGMTRTWLMQIFKNDGIVMGAFISLKKRRNTDLPFGFVRFRNKEEAAKALQRNNGLTIRGKSMRLSWAKYYNKSLINQQQTSKLPTKTTKPIVRTQPIRNPAWRDDRSYKEVTVNRRVIEVEEEEEFKEWLSKTFVCKPYNDRNLEEIEGRLAREGLVNLAVSKFDSERFILNRRAEGKQLSINEEEMAKLKNIFSEIKPWSCNIKHRWIKHVEIVGLPLHLWNLNNLKKICEKWGSLSEVISMEDSLEACAIIIETEEIMRIDEVINLKHDLKLHAVAIRELCPCSIKQKYERKDTEIVNEATQGMNPIPDAIINPVQQRDNRGEEVTTATPVQSVPGLVYVREEDQNLENLVTNFIIETMALEQHKITGRRGEEQSPLLNGNLNALNCASGDEKGNDEAANSLLVEEAEESPFQTKVRREFSVIKECHVEEEALQEPTLHLNDPTPEKNQKETTMSTGLENISSPLIEPTSSLNQQLNLESPTTVSSPISIEALLGLDDIDFQAGTEEKEVAQSPHQLTSKRDRGRPRRGSVIQDEHHDEAIATWKVGQVLGLTLNEEERVTSELRRSLRLQKRMGRGT